MLQCCSAGWPVKFAALQVETVLPDSLPGIATVKDVEAEVVGV